MKTELSKEDRERIEQAVEEYTKDWPRNKLPANKVAFRNGAEYATIYERESWIKQCEILITQRNEVTELSKKEINRLEAERSELRNKVIGECIESLKAKGVEESDYNGKIILSTLNSLKTK